MSVDAMDVDDEGGSLESLLHRKLVRYGQGEYFWESLVLPEDAPVEDTVSCFEPTIAPAEFDSRMRNQAIRGYLSLSAEACDEYRQLITYSPSLFNSQKVTLLKHEAWAKLTCSCFLERNSSHFPFDTTKVGYISPFLHLSLAFHSGSHPILRLLPQLANETPVPHLKNLETFILTISSALSSKCQYSSNCKCSCVACGAVQGNRDCFKILGTLFHQGFGVPLDFKLALACYTIASALGSASAMNSIGFMYQEGHGMTPNTRVAVEWYTFAASMSDRTSQYNIACASYKGTGLVQNSTSAFKWYLLAAMQGDSDAQCAVGDQHFLGEGVSQNKSMAFQWHLRAARSGSLNAQTTMGHHYYYGWTQDIDFGKAFEWYHKAASRNHPQAQYFLGNMYYEGSAESKVKNLQAAFYWWVRSAENGCCLGMEGLKLIYKTREFAHFDHFKSLYWRFQALRVSGSTDWECKWKESLSKSEVQPFESYRKSLRHVRNGTFISGFLSNSSSELNKELLSHPLFDPNIIGAITSIAGDSCIRFDEMDLVIM